MIFSARERALQWGRARPHAEIHPRAPHRHAHLQASMGPRASARGNRITAFRRNEQQPASMGPRASARGNHVRHDRLHPHVSASMGPRASARGNLQTRLDAAAFADTASMGPRASARGNRSLRGRKPGRKNGFNGAARVRTRKCDRRGRPRRPRTRFNGAARVRTRKFEAYAVANLVAKMASMGPRASARGNDAPSARSSAGLQRFNGAARVRTRKWSSNGASRSLHQLLQWGRARPHAEIFKRGLEREHPERASMGPRASARGNITICQAASALISQLQWGRARPHAEISGF